MLILCRSLLNNRFASLQIIKITEREGLSLSEAASAGLYSIHQRVRGGRGTSSVPLGKEGKEGKEGTEGKDGKDGHTHSHTRPGPRPGPRPHRPHRPHRRRRRRRLCSRVATASGDWDIRIWDIQRGECIATLRGTNNDYYSSIDNDYLQY